MATRCAAVNLIVLGAKILRVPEYNTSNRYTRGNYFYYFLFFQPQGKMKQVQEPKRRYREARKREGYGQVEECWRRVMNDIGDGDSNVS